MEYDHMGVYTPRDTGELAEIIDGVGSPFEFRHGEGRFMVDTHVHLFGERSRIMGPLDVVPRLVVDVTGYDEMRSRTGWYFDALVWTDMRCGDIDLTEDLMCMHRKLLGLLYENHVPFFVMGHPAEDGGVPLAVCEDDQVKVSTEVFGDLRSMFPAPVERYL